MLYCRGSRPHDGKEMKAFPGEVKSLPIAMVSSKDCHTPVLRRLALCSTGTMPTS